jgi:protein involved in polysaccharide export with SLBB domain
VNFVIYIVRKWKSLFPVNLFLSLFLLICLSGCGDNVQLPSANQLSEFENAGPLQPEVDIDQLVKARTGTGPYQVVPNDLLELQIPAILRLVNVGQLDSPELLKPYLCRAYEDGTITLPIIGKVQASGKTLAEIETVIANAYYPRWYSVELPSIVARVAKYYTVKVSIVGAVTNPGTYELQSDQMSLVTLIMMAGGIVDEGAAVIRITHQQNAVADADKAEVPRETPTQLENTLLQALQELQQVTEQAPVQVIERPAQLQTVAPILPADYPETGQVEVQLAFCQFSQPETTGLLTMKHNKTILLTEQLDISSEIQRRAVIEKLAQKDSRFSTQEVNYRLCELAELLKPGSDRYNSDSQTAYAHTNSTDKINTSDSKPNTFSDEVLVNDLLKILELEKSLGMQETTNLGKMNESKTLILPIKGFNIPFADVALQEGDSIEVERLELPLVTVVGLVNKPGNFEYPPDVQYNLMQALGFAGGLNQAAEPRYATVYRLKADGEIVSAAFEFQKDSGLTDGSNVLIKPGDIVAVEHTPRTRTNLFLDRVFRINMGLYVPISDITGND